MVYKLCDFGMAQKLTSSQLLSSYVGTKNYMSIEVLENRSYTIKADMWSLGTILFEMLYGVNPFLTDMGRVEDIHEKMKNGFSMPDNINGVSVSKT